MRDSDSKPTRHPISLNPRRSFSIHRDNEQAAVDAFASAPRGTRAPARIFRHQETVTSEQLERQAQDIVRRLDAIECSISANPQGPSRSSTTENFWRYSVNDNRAAKPERTPEKAAQHDRRLGRKTFTQSTGALSNDIRTDQQVISEKMGSKSNGSYKNFDHKLSSIKSRREPYQSERTYRSVGDFKPNLVKNSDLKRNVEDYDSSYRLESSEDPVTKKHVIRIQFLGKDEYANSYHRNNTGKRVNNQRNSPTFPHSSLFENEANYVQSSSHADIRKLNQVHHRWNQGTDYRHTSQNDLTSPINSSTLRRCQTNSAGWPLTRVREYSRSPSPPPAPVLPSAGGKTARRRSTSCVMLAHGNSADRRNNRSKLKATQSLETHQLNDNFSKSTDLCEQPGTHRGSKQISSIPSKANRCSDLPEEHIKKDMDIPRNDRSRFIRITHTNGFLQETNNDRGLTKSQSGIYEATVPPRLLETGPSQTSKFRSSNTFANSDISLNKNIGKHCATHTRLTEGTHYENFDRKFSDPPMRSRNSPSRIKAEHRLGRDLYRSLSHDPNHVQYFDSRGNDYDQYHGDRNFSGTNNSMKHPIESDILEESNRFGESSTYYANDFEKVPNVLRKTGNMENIIARKDYVRVPDVSISRTNSNKRSAMQSKVKTHQMRESDVDLRNNNFNYSTNRNLCPEEPLFRSIGVQYNGDGSGLVDCCNKTHESSPNNENFQQQCFCRPFQNNNKPDVEKNHTAPNVIVDSTVRYSAPVHTKPVIDPRQPSKPSRQRVSKERRTDRVRSRLRPSHTFIVRRDSDQSSGTELSDSGSAAFGARAKWTTRDRRVRAQDECGATHGTRLINTLPVYPKRFEHTNSRFQDGSSRSSIVSSSLTCSSPSSYRVRDVNCQEYGGKPATLGFVQRFIDREPVLQSERRDGVRNYSQMQKRLEPRELLPPRMNGVRDAFLDNPGETNGRNSFSHEKNMADVDNSMKNWSTSADGTKTNRKTNWKLKSMWKFFSPTLTSRKRQRAKSDSLKKPHASYASSSTKYEHSQVPQIYMAYNIPPNDANVIDYQEHDPFHHQTHNTPSIMRSTSHVSEQRLPPQTAPALPGSPKRGAPAPTVPDGRGTTQTATSPDRRPPVPSGKKSVFLHATTVADIPSQTQTSSEAVTSSSRGAAAFAPAPCGEKSSRVKRSFSLLGLLGGCKQTQQSGTVYRAVPWPLTDTRGSQSGARSQGVNRGAILPAGLRPLSYCSAVDRSGPGCSQCRPVLTKTLSA